MQLHTKAQRAELEKISILLGNLIADHEAGLPVYRDMAQAIDAHGPVPTVEEISMRESLESDQA